MPAFQAIRATSASAPSLRVEAIAAGVRVALPTSSNLEYVLTNLGLVDVFAAFGDVAVVCTLPAGATPGIPVLGRTQPIVRVSGAATHVYLISVAGSVDVLLTPGSSV